MGKLTNSHNSGSMIVARAYIKSYIYIHPRKLTCPWKPPVWKRKSSEPKLHFWLPAVNFQGEVSTSPKKNKKLEAKHRKFRFEHPKKSQLMTHSWCSRCSFCWGLWTLCIFLASSVGKKIPLLNWGHLSRSNSECQLSTTDVPNSCRSFFCVGVAHILDPWKSSRP